jgi:hypothetical protein
MPKRNLKSWGGPKRKKRKQRKQAKSSKEIKDQSLVDDHVQVIMNDQIMECFPQIQASFLKTLEDLPEFVDKKVDRVLGGFGALGVASSFHNPFVRRLRQWVMAAVWDYLPSTNEFVELLIDRMMVRKIGSTTTAEQWHMDEEPNSCIDDVIYGGWINTGICDQYFVCVPGSGGGDGKNGFHKIPKSEHDDLNSKKVVYTIPPGGIILFNSNIKHVVHSCKIKNNNLNRLFIGIRLTNSLQTLNPNKMNDMKLQLPMMLKSGQESNMYGKLHICNHINKLVSFSAGIKDCYKHVFTYKSGSRKGDIYFIVRKKLFTNQNHLQPEYTIQEINAHKPSNSLRVLNIGSKNKFITLIKKTSF